MERSSYALRSVDIGSLRSAPIPELRTIGDEDIPQLVSRTAFPQQKLQSLRLVFGGRCSLISGVVSTMVLLTLGLTVWRLKSEDAAELRLRYAGDTRSAKYVGYTINDLDHGCSEQDSIVSCKVHLPHDMRL